MINGISVSVSDDEEVAGKMRVRIRHRRKKPGPRQELLGRVVRSAMRWWSLLLVLPVLFLLFFETTKLARRPRDEPRSIPVALARDSISNPKEAPSDANAAVRKSTGNLNRLDRTTRVVNGVRERKFCSNQLLYSLAFS